MAEIPIMFWLVGWLVGWVVLVVKGWEVMLFFVIFGVSKTLI